jgi:hypothetical protein
MPSGWYSEVRGRSQPFHVTPYMHVVASSTTRIGSGAHRCWSMGRASPTHVAETCSCFGTTPCSTGPPSTGALFRVLASAVRSALDIAYDEMLGPSPTLPPIARLPIAPLQPWGSRS